VNARDLSTPFRWLLSEEGLPSSPHYPASQVERIVTKLHRHLQIIDLDGEMINPLTLISFRHQSASIRKPLVAPWVTVLSLALRIKTLPVFKSLGH
jgi:hypothetical protein